MNTKELKIINQETLHKGFLSVNRYTLQHSLYKGGMSEPLVREVLERGHAVAVLLHDPARDEIVMVEEFRIGAIHSESAWLCGPVAGMIEAGEDPEDVARREAMEESGSTVEELQYIGKYYNSAGGSTETTAVFYAQIDASNVEGVHGVEGEHEDIRVVKLSTKAFRELLSSDTTHTASTMIAGLWFIHNYPAG